MINNEYKFTEKDLGTLVSIPHYPDHENKCRHSGCPTYRQAYGVVVEVFEDRRLVCIVEGKEKYFFFYDVKLIGGTK